MGNDIDRSKPRRLVTLSDVAARAGVSRSSVSYALTQPSRASRSMNERVRKAASELGYVVNDAARQLRVGQSRAIGLIVVDAVNPVYSAVAAGAELTARLNNRYVFVANSSFDRDRELEYIRFFESQRVSGIIITPVDGIPTALQDVERRGTPFVMIGDAAESHPHFSVNGDDEKGGYMAVMHLVSQGRRQLVMVLGGPESLIRQRTRGAMRAAQECNVILTVVRTSSPTIDDGEAVAEALLSSAAEEGLPDGIFAMNDLIALGIIQEFVKNGVQIPAQVSIVGYDDIDFARTAIIPLTSVRHPVKEMGSAAIDILLRRLSTDGTSDDDPTQLLFAPTLVVRSTTRT